MASTRKAIPGHRDHPHVHSLRQQETNTTAETLAIEVITSSRPSFEPGGVMRPPQSQKRWWGQRRKSIVDNPTSIPTNFETAHQSVPLNLVQRIVVDNDLRGHHQKSPLEGPRIGGHRRCRIQRSKHQTRRRECPCRQKGKA